MEIGAHQERSNHRALLILLGQQLYHRDFGTDPPTPEVLVGPYLKSLPAELLEDGRDETIPLSGRAQAHEESRSAKGPHDALSAQRLAIPVFSGLALSRSGVRWQ